nr:ATP-binding protein [Roseospira goensis]
MASSLALQQTMRLLAVTLAAAILFLGAQGVWQLRAAQAEYRDQQTRTARSLRAGLAKALFDFDATTARSILDGTLASGPIRSVVVWHHDGRPFVSAGREMPRRVTRPWHDVLAGLIDLDRRQVLRLDHTDLTVRTKWTGPLGSVVVYYDDTVLLNALAADLVSQSLGLLFIIGIVAAVTGVAVHRFVSRHILALARRVDAVDPDHPAEHALPVPEIHRTTELGRLSRGLNSLLHRLAAAQTALENSEHKYRTIVERTPVAMVVTDLAAPPRVIEANAAACALLGLDRAALVGHTMADIGMAPEGRLADLSARIRAEGASRFQMRYRTREGAPRDAEVFAAAFPLDGRDHIFSLIIDITERLRIERDRDTALQMALSSKKAQADFLASMSHELRTPLNAILGFADVIRGELLGPVGVRQYAGYAADIHTSGTHLLGLINDILDLSRIETGAAPLEFAALDLRQEVDAAVKTIQPTLTEKRQRLTVALPANLPVMADRRAVRQMLANLLSNAAKFTPEGGAITVLAHATHDGGLRLSVSDTGVGVAPRDRDRIFQAFRQAVNTTTREIDGSGLGLALVRTLIESHGGRVTVDSTPGRGATFTLVFPPQLAAA